jgi:sulfite reductase (NADPH) flavoprotein alpha-component
VDREISITLADRRRLSREGDGREVFLLTFRGPDNLDHVAGDWLAITPENGHWEVEKLLLVLRRPGDLPLRAALRRRAIGRVSPALVKFLLHGDEAPPDGCGVADFLLTRGIPPPPAEELIAQLPPLRPRTYSLASAPECGRGRLRLLVATAVHRLANGGIGRGVASAHLNRRLPIGGTVTARLIHSHFHLPEDGKTDIIMVATGAGLAPFLGFLERRDRLRAMGGALGRSWLFFGARNRSVDFLCEDELSHHRASGVLDRLDLAFSRDQAEKIYVQDRIRENGEELWRWLGGGAHFYVCGNARAMAADVDAALEELAVRHGKMEAADARSFVGELRRSKRYLRDVY